MYSKKSKNPFVLTLGIKVFFLVLLFAGIPYMLVTLSNRYQQKASGIIDQERAIVEIQTEKTKELKVLTQAEANTLNKISDFIGGIWVSELDGRYRIEIDSNNKFAEFYDDSKEGFGVWRVFSGAPGQVDLSNSPEIADDSDDGSGGFSSGRSNAEKQEGDILVTARDTARTETAPTSSAYTKSQFEDITPADSKYFFQKQQYEPGHKGEKYVYQIQQLDTEKFVLVYKGGTGRPLVFVRSTSTQAN